MTTYDIARKINGLADMANMRWHGAAVFDARPGLKATLASQIAYAIGDAEVLYLHASISSAESKDALVQVAAFTEELFVRASSHGDLTTMSVHRSRLHSLTLHVVPDLLQGGLEGTTPVVLSLNYGLGSEVAPIVLGSAFQTPRNARELEKFLPSLRSDLRRKRPRLSRRGRLCIRFKTSPVGRECGRGLSVARQALVFRRGDGAKSLDVLLAGD